MNTNENKNGRHLVRPSESELAAMYAEHTTKEIAELYNVSHYTVYNWVQHYRRNPENNEINKHIKTGGRPPKRPPESELAALYADHTAAEIAAMYDVSLWTVRKWIHFYRSNHEKSEGVVLMPDKARKRKVNNNG